MISLHDFDFPRDDESLSEEERALLEKFRDCDHIVHGWDDWGPGGFAAVWGKVFAEAFAP
jgi:hypothetical protein